MPFLKHSKKRIKKLLQRGKKYILNDRFNYRLSPMSTNIEQGIYDSFSDQIHSLPISIELIIGEGGIQVMKISSPF